MTIVKFLDYMHLYSFGIAILVTQTTSALHLIQLPNHIQMLFSSQNQQCSFKI